MLILSAGCAGIRPPAPVAHPAPTVAQVVAGDPPCVQTTRSCIPLNPEVTQDTIQQTICAPRYTRTVRPSSSVMRGVKAQLMREARLDESHIAAYELDHIVPLALGGHPRKLANLMLQPWAGEHGAERKDLLERRLQILVCRGELKLNEAQACIAENWEACDAQHMAR